VILEADDREGVGLTADLGSARLHGADLLVVCKLDTLSTHDEAYGSPFLSTNMREHRE
jgi:hypothetical protein